MNLQREQREQIEATYAPLLAGVEKLKEEGSELKATGLVKFIHAKCTSLQRQRRLFWRKSCSRKWACWAQPLVRYSKLVFIGCHLLEALSGAGRNPKSRADGNCRASSISPGRLPTPFVLPLVVRKR